MALGRLALMDRLSLTDNTESRYGLIGWQMYHSGDWVTPRIYVNGALQPFNAKPPLQFWLTALSYTAFGVSPWSARMPAFLIGLGLVAGTGWFAGRLWGPRAGALAAVILAASALFFLNAGACALDMPLAAAVTGAMLAFARCADRPRHPTAWGLAFFFALALGALAKGPIALVLVGLAIGGWLLITRRWRLLAELPWRGGFVVFLAVAAPWYCLAERATPGFLRYFLINEHLRRYVTDDYGDQYGAGRVQPYGAIWLMLAASLLPWTVLAVAALARLFRANNKSYPFTACEVAGTLRVPSAEAEEGAADGTRSVPATLARPISGYKNAAGPLAHQGQGVRAAVTSAFHRLLAALRAEPWLTYALVWGLAPALFFTLARQILATYLLPGLPGLAIVIAVALDRWLDSDAAPALRAWLKWHFVAVCCLTPVAAAVTLAFGAGAWWAAALVALPLLLAWLAAPQFRGGNTAALVAIFALTTSAVFALAALSVTGRLDEEYSARTILAELDRTAEASGRAVVMPFGEASSAAFYAEAVFRQPFDHRRPEGGKLIRKLLDRGGREIFLIKPKDWAYLEPDLFARLTPLVRTDHWVACVGVAN
jgi:4-amino-4-deoxy-L-arabinose transferase-like glycosyltransferase